jgi:transposase
LLRFCALQDAFFTGQSHPPESISASLDEYVPEGYLLRPVNRKLELSEFHANLADSYSHTGRPSIDPNPMIRMLIIGCCYGIHSEHRLSKKVRMNLPYR